MLKLSFQPPNIIQGLYYYTPYVFKIFPYYQTIQIINLCRDIYLTHVACRTLNIKQYERYYINHISILLKRTLNLENILGMRTDPILQVRLDIFEILSVKAVGECF